MPGGLSREQVRRVVRRNLGQVRFCYEQALTRDPDLEGRVSVRFVVQPSGAVMASTSEGSSIGNPAVEDCVVQAVRRWSFPSAPGLTVVRYPFVLASTP
jgi:TonB family protein